MHESIHNIKQQFMDPLSTTQSKEDDTDLRCPCYCEENVWRLLERRRLLHQRCHSSASSSSTTSKRRPEQHYYVAFISNENQTVAMLHQKAASSTTEEGLIVWDYHVILLCYAEQQQSLSDDEQEEEDDTAASSTNANYDPTKEPSDSKNIGLMMLVYDLDTTLEPYPLPLADYLDRSFPSRTGSSSTTTTARSRTMMMRKQPQLYRPKFRIVPADEFRHYFASDRSHMWNAATGQYNAPPPPYECITTAGSSSHRTTTIIGVDADTAATAAAKKNHHHGSPALQTNTLPYYLNFQDNHQRQCPLPKEALGVILSLEEVYQVDRWSSSLS
jgi:N-terminal glutamine amidase